MKNKSEPKHLLLAIVIFLTGIFFSTAVFAANSQTEYLKDYFTVIWGLLIVLGIMLILYGLLRKRFSILANGADKEIKVLEVRPIMGKKAICLVQVKDREFLLGISENTISQLASFPVERSAFEKNLQDAVTEKTK